MEQELMIDSKAVKTLRNNAGWSQEQLAKASGLSLRTIQRAETDGKSSMETKVCLAATFKVPMEQITPESAEIAGQKSYNKFVLLLLVISLPISLLGVVFQLPEPIQFASNAAAIFSAIFCALKWYFAPVMKITDSVRYALSAGLIFCAIFMLFALVGSFEAEILSPMLLATAFFAGIFIVSGVRHFVNNRQ